jgi:hypothetical protein
MDRSVLDAAERVPDAESFGMGGPPAARGGAARGRVDGPVVVLLPDSWDRYLSTAWLRRL